MEHAHSYIPPPFIVSFSREGLLNIRPDVNERLTIVLIRMNGFTAIQILHVIRKNINPITAKTIIFNFSNHV